MTGIPKGRLQVYVIGDSGEKTLLVGEADNVTMLVSELLDRERTQRRVESVQRLANAYAHLQVRVQEYVPRLAELVEVVCEPDARHKPPVPYWVKKTHWRKKGRH